MAGFIATSTQAHTRHTRVERRLDAQVVAEMHDHQDALTISSGLRQEGDVLSRVYAKCVVGQEGASRRRIQGPGRPKSGP